MRACFDAPEPNELTSFIRKLAELRGRGDAASHALNYGDYRNVQIQNKQLLFARADADARVYIAINAVAESYTFSSDELNGSFTDLLKDDDMSMELAGSLELEPYDVRYLLKN